MCLYVPVNELRAALALHDPPQMAAAMSRLRYWCEDVCSPEQMGSIGMPDFMTAATEAIVLIALTNSATGPQGRSSGIRYRPIAVFLAHVVLWAFAQLATPAMKRQLVEGAARDIFCLQLSTSKDIEALLSLLVSTNHDSCRLILRQGSHKLTEMGPWGVSLNLALLLYRRSNI